MADKTGISWTASDDGRPGATWNPTTGCDQISSGCDRCYALTLAKRLKAMGSARYQTDGDPLTSGPGFGLAMHPETLDIPRRWRAPRRVFVNSMSDLFHDSVTDEFIADVFAVMLECERHTFQVLTKRSRRLKALAAELPWPPNIWMGVSVETDRYTFRARDLEATPAAVKFVSAEPLLGALPSLDVSRLDWVIAGGESGAGFRKPHGDWFRDLRDRCHETETPFFFKQWGGVNKKANGRELQGNTYDNMPNCQRQLAFL